MLAMAIATSLRAGAFALAIISERRLTVSSWPPARATVSTCAVRASFRPEQAPRASTETSTAERTRIEGISKMADGRGRTGDDTVRGGRLFGARGPGLRELAIRRAA